MDRTLCVKCHVLKADGTEKIDVMDVNDIVFDTSKYLDKNGELYFCEQTVDGAVKNIIVTKDTYYQKCMGLNISAPKKKKLGFGHILFAYVWLPITVFIYFVIIIGTIGMCFYEKTFMKYAPDICFSIAVLVTSCALFISMVFKGKGILIVLHTYFVAHLTASVQMYISDIMTHTSIIDCIPLDIALIGVLYLCTLSYYKKREYIFTEERNDILSRNSAVIALFIQIGIAICFDCMLYIYSVIQMFQISSGYGLFGIFAPVISQFAFLIDEGFDSVYAYAFYYAVIATVAGFGPYLIQSKQDEL